MNKPETSQKTKKRDLEPIFKELELYGTAEEKVEALQQKYATVVKERNKLQFATKAMEKRSNILQKEKEQLQSEHNKVILAKSRLENLCRELQRQNKAIKDESLTAMREEEEKKREVAAVFHSTLTELSNLVTKNNDKNQQIRVDNLEMSNRLKMVCEQYETKEKHVEKLAKQLELEMQLTEARMKKAQMEMQLEREEANKEKQDLLLELNQYKTTLNELKTTEVNLRKQIQMYNDKYDDFHMALVQSNEAIKGFKEEMDKMSKHINKLEKETLTWKTKYDAVHKALLQMTDEKLKSDKNSCATLRKLKALQSLCRTLQSTCNSLRAELKEKEKGEKLEAGDSEDKELATQKILDDLLSDHNLNDEEKLLANVGEPETLPLKEITETSTQDDAPCPTKIAQEKLNTQAAAEVQESSSKEILEEKTEKPKPEVSQRGKKNKGRKNKN